MYVSDSSIPTQEKNRTFNVPPIKLLCTVMEHETPGLLIYNYKHELLYERGTTH